MERVSDWDSREDEGTVLADRPLVSRRVSPILFATILIAFALPFGTVSCEGPPVKFTGYALATWQVQQTSPPATTDDGASLPQAIEHSASFWALLMLLAAVTGLAFGLAGRRGAGFAVTAGLVGVVALAAQPLDMSAPEIDYEVGFQIAALVYSALALWHIGFAVRRRRV
jgi:hypothetical protein